MLNGLHEIHCGICGCLFYHKNPNAKYCCREHSALAIKRNTAKKDKIRNIKKRKGIARLPLTSIYNVIIDETPELKNFVYATGNTGNRYAHFSDNDIFEYKMYSKIADIFRNRYYSRKTIENAISEIWAGERKLSLIDEENYELWQFFTNERKNIGVRYWNNETQTDNKNSYETLRKQSMRDIARAAINEFPMLSILAKGN